MNCPCIHTCLSKQCKLWMLPAVVDSKLIYLKATAARAFVKASSFPVSTASFSPAHGQKNQQGVVVFFQCTENLFSNVREKKRKLVGSRNNE